MVEIKGLEKFASRDFPGHISSTVFLGGCNFRCPYCHNADLVLQPQSLPTTLLDAFICYLDMRQGWLEGVCVSGGEPLLTPHLEELLLVIKEQVTKTAPGGTSIIVKGKKKPTTKPQEATKEE